MPAGYYLVVSRLLPYKNVDQVIEAFRDLPENLVVVGQGPLLKRVRAIAADTVKIVSGLSDAQMRWVYSHTGALVAASHEDFGLTPLEAGAFVLPTLVLRDPGPRHHLLHRSLTSSGCPRRPRHCSPGPRST